MNRDVGKLSASGVGFVLATLLGWSSVPLFLRYFTSYMDAWTANGWRYSIAALFWLPVVLAACARRTLKVELLRDALIPSLANAAGQVCFAWAPYYIQPGLMTFLLRFQIVFIAIGAWILFPSERVVLRSGRYWRGLIAVFLGSIGTIMLGSEPLVGGHVRGIMLALVSGLGYGAYALSVRRYVYSYHPVVSFGVISLYTAALMVAVMAIFGARHGMETLSLSASGWWLLIASSLSGIALGHVFYYASIARLGVAISSGVMLLQPVIVGVTSYFLFDERLTAGQWLCGLVAIGGAALMVSTQGRRVSTASESHGPATAPSKSAA